MINFNRIFYTQKSDILSDITKGVIHEKVNIKEDNTLQLSLDTHISAVGISIPITLQVTKTAESQQYWK